MGLSERQDLSYIFQVSPKRLQQRKRTVCVQVDGAGWSSTSGVVVNANAGPGVAMRFLLKVHRTYGRLNPSTRDTVGMTENLRDKKLNHKPSTKSLLSTLKLNLAGDVNDRVTGRNKFLLRQSKRRSELFHNQRAKELRSVTLTVSLFTSQIFEIL